MFRCMGKEGARLDLGSAGEAVHEAFERFGLVALCLALCQLPLVPGGTEAQDKIVVEDACDASVLLRSAPAACTIVSARASMLPRILRQHSFLHGEAFHGNAFRQGVCGYDIHSLGNKLANIHMQAVYTASQ